jgi:hypothetical protein
MKRRRHTPEQIVRKLREARLRHLQRLADLRQLLPLAQQPVDVSPLAGAVRRDEGRPCQAAQGAGGRERAVGADRGRSDARDGGVARGEPGSLVSPSRRRQAVLMPQDRLGLSERRAWRIVGQHRSTQRHEPGVAGDDQALRSELRRISRRRPRWGYRRAHQLLLDERWALNRKRTQRLWREEGLRVPQRRRKRQRLGESTVPCPAPGPGTGSCVGDRFSVRSDRRRAQPQAAARRRRVHSRGARDRLPTPGRR